MKDVLSPKELAAAIGVSESSLRRWVDSGALKTSRTVGGHRRIPLAEAVRFIRESHANVVRPELLGLRRSPRRPPARPILMRKPTGSIKRCWTATRRSRAASSCRSTSPARRSRRCSTGRSPPACAAWANSGGIPPRGVLTEHRATDIIVQVVAQLRQLLPPPAMSAPLAIGGAPPDDVYLLPSQMAAATLADAGYVVQNLGPDTPLDTLRIGVEELRPRLIYLSVTSLTAIERLSAKEIYSLADQAAGVDATLLVGGQQLSRLHLAPRAHLQLIGSMAELAAFARGTLSSPALVPTL